MFLPTPRALRAAVVLAIAPALLAGAALYATATPETGGQTRIVGGQKLPDQKYNPGVVTVSSDSTNCAGARIAPEWVLTARHCSDGKYGAKPTHVYLEGLYFQKGPKVKVTDIQIAPQGDIALLKIDGATTRSTLMYYSIKEPAAGAEAWAYGWGAESPSVSNSDVLKVAKATVQRMHSPGALYKHGKDILVKGVDGVAYSGDSGGPLMIGGVAYGSVSGGTHKGTDINADEYYAWFGDSAQWIQKTSGVAPYPG